MSMISWEPDTPRLSARPTCNWCFNAYNNMASYSLLPIASLERKRFISRDITMKHCITPSFSTTVAIKEFSKPSTVRGLQELFGMVNFYHRFIPSAANIIQPLYQALAGNLEHVQ